MFHAYADFETTQHFTLDTPCTPGTSRRKGSRLRVAAFRRADQDTITSFSANSIAPCGQRRPSAPLGPTNFPFAHHTVLVDSWEQHSLNSLHSIIPCVYCTVGTAPLAHSMAITPHSINEYQPKEPLTSS